MSKRAWMKRGVGVVVLIVKVGLSWLGYSFFTVPGKAESLIRHNMFMSLLLVQAEYQTVTCCYYELDINCPPLRFRQFPDSSSQTAPRFDLDNLD